MIERTRCVLGTLPKIHSERFESFEREISFEDRIFRFFPRSNRKKKRKKGGNLSRLSFVIHFFCDCYYINFSRHERPLFRVPPLRVPVILSDPYQEFRDR